MRSSGIVLSHYFLKRCTSCRYCSSLVSPDAYQSKLWSKQNTSQTSSLITLSSNGSSFSRRFRLGNSSITVIRSKRPSEDFFATSVVAVIEMSSAHSSPPCCVGTTSTFSFAYRGYQRGSIAVRNGAFHCSALPFLCCANRRSAEPLQIAS